MSKYPDRDLRQREIVPPESLQQVRATVVGVGAVGRQVSLQLAAMGAPQLHLIDHDNVEEVNLATQGFEERDLKQDKVDAVAQACRRLNSQVQITTLTNRFRASGDVGNVLFCCVDSIQTRSLIWRAVRDRVQLFIDGRMHAEVVRVLTCALPGNPSYYQSTLFRQEQAHQGSCTARSTIYTANIAAGLMVQQFTRWLRHIPVDADLQLNLLSSELTLMDTVQTV